MSRRQEENDRSPASGSDTPLSSASASSRLTSLLPSGVPGGLVKKRKQQNPQDGPVKANSSSSRLGLDRLASERKQGKSHKQQEHQQKQPKQRNYRSRIDSETPSHPGGINREVQHRAREREKQWQRPYHIQEGRGGEMT